MKESGWITPIENMATTNDNLPYLLKFNRENSGIVRGRISRRKDIDLNVLTVLKIFADYQSVFKNDSELCISNIGSMKNLLNMYPPMK